MKLQNAPYTRVNILCYIIHFALNCLAVCLTQHNVTVSELWGRSAPTRWCRGLWGRKPSRTWWAGHSGQGEQNFLLQYTNYFCHCVNAKFWTKKTSAHQEWPSKYPNDNFLEGWGLISPKVRNPVTIVPIHQVHRNRYWNRFTKNSSTSLSVKPMWEQALL